MRIPYRNIFNVKPYFCVTLSALGQNEVHSLFFPPQNIAHYASFSPKHVEAKTKYAILCFVQPTSFDLDINEALRILFLTVSLRSRTITYINSNFDNFCDNGPL